MRRILATLAVAASVAAPVLSAAPAEAIYCGPVVHQYVCSPYCQVTYHYLGWHCFA